ncbi:MAG TPA: non-canonical purine NTP pyrophosphatase [Gemmatimonadaceae bacterium]
MTRRLLLATRSAGKLRELRALLESAGYAPLDLREAGIDESPAEDALEQYETFEENALAKGRYFAARAGLPVLADDSGLEVAALDGAPGVRSKRWSGRTDLSGDALDRENNALLIRSLADATDRRARYVCAAAYVDGNREIVRRGIVSGHIVAAPRGDGGFGYDPFFESDELGRTFGEVSAAEKASVSHRARAVRALVAALERR